MIRTLGLEKCMLAVWSRTSPRKTSAKRRKSVKSMRRENGWVLIWTMVVRRPIEEPEKTVDSPHFEHESLRLQRTHTSTKEGGKLATSSILVQKPNLFSVFVVSFFVVPVAVRVCAVRVCPSCSCRHSRRLSLSSHPPLHGMLAAERVRGNSR